MITLYVDVLRTIILVVFYSIRNVNLLITDLLNHLFVCVVCYPALQSQWGDTMSPSFDIATQD
jgi:hypothetical protein